MRPIRLAALVTLGAGVVACAPLRSHQGYIVDADLVNSVQPGVDNRQSVAATLGRPSFESQFGQRDWFYLARDSRSYAFNRPKATSQLTLQISFDANDTVSAIRKADATQIASISPDGKTTPTLGRKRGFFQDLFGNIGTVGAAGAGAAPGGGAPGR